MVDSVLTVRIQIHYPSPAISRHTRPTDFPSYMMDESVSSDLYSSSRFILDMFPEQSVVYSIRQNVKIFFQEQINKDLQPKTYM